MEEFLLMQNLCDIHHQEALSFNFVDRFYISFGFFSSSMMAIDSVVVKVKNSEEKVNISEVDEYVAELLPLALQSSQELKKTFGCLAFEPFLCHLQVMTSRFIASLDRVFDGWRVYRECL